MKKALLVGVGEIGSAVKEILESNGYDVSTITEYTYDVDSKDFEVVHVAIPGSGAFVKNVESNLEGINFGLCIVHSTVPVGTMKLFKDKRFVHSPVRGVHPNLVPGIKTFVKFVGGDSEYVEKAMSHMEGLGITCEAMGSYEETEMFKLLSTTYYGWNILFAKECKALCDKFGLDYDNVYTRANETYNDGYKKLDMEQVCRPVLYPPEGKIGGHCITPNWDLLPNCELKNMSKKLDNI